jgi:hypothetical protein
MPGIYDRLTNGDASTYLHSIWAQSQKGNRDSDTNLEVNPAYQEVKPGWDLFLLEINRSSVIVETCFVGIGFNYQQLLADRQIIGMRYFLFEPVQSPNGGEHFLFGEWRGLADLFDLGQLRITSKRTMIDIIHPHLG